MEKYQTHCMKQEISETGGFELEYLPQAFGTKFGDASFSYHTHTFYEIIWFMEGEGTHSVDFVDYPLEPNTFFFITPGQLHKYNSRKQKGIIYKFLPEFLNEEYTNENIYLQYSLFNAFDAEPRLVVKSPEVLSSVQNITMGLERELPRSELYEHQSFMKSLIRLLLIIFQRHGNKYLPDKANSITSNMHSHFLRFRQLLEKEYHRLHNVKDYATLMGVSTKYLTTVVTECSHRTPLQLIHERLLLEAKRQLKYSDRIIKEIAFSLGFDDPSYFVKRFKALTGYSPIEFREL